MDRIFWARLQADEVAEQADLWRYAAEENRRRRRFGLARWCQRMSNEALSELAVREAEERVRLAWGDQLAFPIEGRVEPDAR